MAPRLVIVIEDIGQSARGRHADGCPPTFRAKTFFPQTTMITSIEK